ncbi:MAG: bifunctional DNA-formamidopyrimidine glycosylase/DNA-(apurinic or apyrimidinic site) lyase [Patescibacteria group bacterium]
MPELPEVQTTVNGINKYVKGLSIKDVWTSYGSAYHAGKDNIKDPKFFAQFKKEVVGKKIIGSKRIAKNILIELSDKSIILIHMKMTGHVLYGDYIFDKKDKKDPWKGLSPKALTDPFNRHIRFVLSLSNGKFLALSDMRRFAKVTHIKKEEIESTLHLANIGPEPLAENFSAEIFRARLLHRPNSYVKQVLMDPSIIAGVGNIYSDELLWRAGMHPKRRVKDIKPAEFQKMFGAMQAVLKAGIDFGGDSMSDYRNILGEKGLFQEKHSAYRKTGTKCTKPKCNGTIHRIVIGARSAHYCDKHQK